MAGGESGAQPGTVARCLILGLLAVQPSGVTAYDGSPNEVAVGNIAAAQALRLVAVQADGTRATVALDRRTYENLREGPSQRVVSLPLDQQRSVTLMLNRFEVLAPSLRFVRATPDGQATRPSPDVIMFRGHVHGMANSQVYASFSARGVSYGYIVLDDGDRYAIARSRPHRGDVARFDVVRQSSIGGMPDFPEFCGTAAHPTANTTRVTSMASRAAYVGSPRVARVAIDADQAYVNLFDNLADAEDYLVQLVGAVCDIYVRDLNVKLMLSFARLWPAGGEPFSADDLSGFASYWINNEDLTGLNLVHMFSGRRGLPYGGVAYVGGTCDGGTFSISGYMLGGFPTPIVDPHLGNWDLVVAAHEMGHNMGTYHTHDGYEPPIDQCASGVNSRGTIMSYCHINPGGLLNTDVRFHARVQDVITEDVAVGNCLWYDCNGNEVDDTMDIAGSTSTDANGNGVPDECEDCDGNGTLDDQDIVDGASDINANGIPDTCEGDCNANNWPDAFETSLGLAADLNGNRRPDECEPDCDENGTADFAEVADGTLDDLDRNTVPDVCQDCDQNDTADWLDLERQHNVYLADLGDYVREYFGASGVPIQNLGAGVVADPMDAVFGADGHLYVASFGNGRIVKIDVDAASASVLVAAGSGGLNSPTGLTFRSNGNLLVSNRSTQEVLEFDGGTGAFVGTFVSGGAGGLLSPYGLQIGPNGNLFVTSSTNAVLEYSGTDGSFTGAFVTAGSGGLSQPRGLAFTPDGRLLVSSFGNNSVLQYDSAGNFLGQFNDGVIPTGAWGVRVGPNGNVFVARHTGALRVLEYEVDTGRYVRSYLRGDPGMTAPTGFAFRPASPNDCNGNLHLDGCDIVEGVSRDLDESGIPDECELTCEIADAPTMEPGNVARNRSVSFVGGNGGALTAIRVTLGNLPSPYDAWNGETLWAGEPYQVCENSAQGLDVSPPDCGPSPGLAQRWFWAAPLYCNQASAHYMDWSTLAMHCVRGTNDGGACMTDGDCPGGACESASSVHLHHEGIVPSRKVPGEQAIQQAATIDIQAVFGQCDLANESSYSAPLGHTQAVWGDVVSTVGDCPNGAPNLNIDVIGDVVALVNKFSNLNCAVPKARADLQPAEIDFLIDFVDVVACVGAFQGGSYPFAPSAAAPCP